MSRARAIRAVLALFCLFVLGCKRPYRVGDRVLVEWEEGSPHLYPAYIVERLGETGYRVHFEGYDSRYDEEVGADRVKGYAVGRMLPPPPPKRVADRASGGASGDAGVNAGVNVVVNPYKVGDRVRVRWRGSVYSAAVVEVVSRDRVRIHYEGHESAWDEEIPLDRIVSR